jgi:hypothetical protein
LADNPPVTALDVKEAFQKLDAKEKLYAHYISTSRPALRCAARSALRRAV